MGDGSGGGLMHESPTAAPLCGGTSSAVHRISKQSRAAAVRARERGREREGGGAGDPDGHGGEGGA